MSEKLLPDHPKGGNGGAGQATSAKDFSQIVYPGGGGGRSQVNIKDQKDKDIVLAIAGGGGGSSGYSAMSTAGAGGGENGESSMSPECTGGDQGSGGNSNYTYPSFEGAYMFKGAGATAFTIDNKNVAVAGGGDGYCGGGSGLKNILGTNHALSSSGGSGYINRTFPGYRSFFNEKKSDTYIGKSSSIPREASDDDDFKTNDLGAGCYSGDKTPGVYGGNGRIVLEFF